MRSIDGEDLLRSGNAGPALFASDTLMVASKPVCVDVLGQVAAPRPIFLYGDETLEQALLEAGGPLSTASTARATLIRNGNESPLSLGGAALRGTPENGDTIVVRAAPRVTVLGQVPTPESVLENKSTLLGTLYVAGGPTKWANVATSRSSTQAPGSPTTSRTCSTAISRRIRRSSTATKCACPKAIESMRRFFPSFGQCGWPFLSRNRLCMEND